VVGPGVTTIALDIGSLIDAFKKGVKLAQEVFGGGGGGGGDANQPY